MLFLMRFGEQFTLLTGRLAEAKVWSLDLFGKHHGSRFSMRTAMQCFRLEPSSQKSNFIGERSSWPKTRASFAKVAMPFVMMKALNGVPANIVMCIGFVRAVRMATLRCDEKSARTFLSTSDFAKRNDIKLMYPTNVFVRRH